MWDPLAAHFCLFLANFCLVTMHELWGVFVLLLPQRILLTGFSFEKIFSKQQAVAGVKWLAARNKPWWNIWFLRKPGTFFFLRFQENSRPASVPGRLFLPRWDRMHILCFLFLHLCLTVQSWERRTASVSKF